MSHQRDEIILTFRKASSSFSSGYRKGTSTACLDRTHPAVSACLDATQSLLLPV